MRKIYSLELLRFIAASAVACVHLNIYFFKDNYNLRFLGDGGVVLFFIISGFVIMLSAENNPNKFFIKRLIRITPTYYFFTIGVFLISLILPNLLTNPSQNIIDLLKSLLFIPFDKNGAGHAPILYLGWTLNYEMYFYIVFALALKLNCKNSDFIVSSLISGVYLLCKNFYELPLSAYSNNIVFTFVLGIFVYRIYLKNYKKAFFIMIIPILTFINNNDLNDRFVNIGILSALFILFSLYLFSKIKLSSFVSVLGGYSYALYLIHPFVFVAFKQLTNLYSSNLFLVFLTLLSLFTANLLSYYFWKFIEIPLIKSLRFKLL